MADMSAALHRARDSYELRARMYAYRNDPELWIRERIHGEVWSAQREIGKSLVENRRTAVKSAHGTGKTKSAAMFVCWWIDVHPPDETLVVTTAPTNDQVRHLMWGYIADIHRKHNLRGSISEAAEWKDNNRQVIGYGRKPSDTNLSAFQGSHAKYLLAVIDEAGGVPQSIWDGVDTITTMPTNRILAIGNPDDPHTGFGDIFLKNDPTWNKITISAFDTPQFTPEREVISLDLLSHLTSREWVEDKEKTWGKEDRRYQSKVLAEFPKESFDALFTSAMIAEAVDCDPAQTDTKVMGVDIARFGPDLSVAVLNNGGQCSVLDSWSKTDTVTSAQKIHKLALDNDVTEVRVDGSGIGGGVVDQLVSLNSSRYVVVEINGGGASPDSKRWYNYRAFLYDHARDLVRDNLIHLPAAERPDSAEQTLQDELAGVRYGFKKGSMLIESKEEIRRRGGKSPDYSDAFTYALAPFDVADPLAGYNVGDTGSIAASEVIADELFDAGFVIAPF